MENNAVETASTLRASGPEASVSGNVLRGGPAPKRGPWKVIAAVIVALAGGVMTMLSTEAGQRLLGVAPAHDSVNAN